MAFEPTGHPYRFITAGPTILTLPTSGTLATTDTGIRLESSSGSVEGYYPTTDTDAARGLALRQAVLAADTGETVYVTAPGTYALGDNGLTLQRYPDAGVNLYLAAGVIVTSTQTLSAGVIVEPGINSHIWGGGTVQGVHAGGLQAPVGIDEDTGGAGTTGIVIDGITMIADNDGWYVKHDTEVISAILRNCTFLTAYDAVAATGSSPGGAHRIDVYNPRIIVTGPSLAALGVSRGVVSQELAIVRVFGGSITVSDGGATLTAGAATLQGGTVELYGTRIVVSSSNTKYDLSNPAGTMRSFGVTGSDTAGALLTTGTIIGATGTGIPVLQTSPSLTTPTLTNPTITNPTITTPTITNPTVTGPTPVVVTSATVTLGATHVNRVVVLNRSTGIAATLPLATGTGSKYELVVVSTFAATSTIVTAQVTDVIAGNAILHDTDDATIHGFSTTNATTLTMATGTNAQGGIIGARIILTDVTTNLWSVEYQSNAASAPSTPFNT